MNIVNREQQEYYTLDECDKVLSLNVKPNNIQDIGNQCEYWLHTRLQDHYHENYNGTCHICKKNHSLFEHIRQKLTKVNPIIETVIIFVLFELVSWVFIPLSSSNMVLNIFSYGLLMGIMIWWCGLSHIIHNRTLHDLGCANSYAIKIRLKKFTAPIGRRNLFLLMGIIIPSYLLFTRNIIESTHLIPGISELNLYLLEKSSDSILFVAGDRKSVV